MMHLSGSRKNTDIGWSDFRIQFEVFLLFRKRTQSAYWIAMSNGVCETTPAHDLNDNDVQMMAHPRCDFFAWRLYILLGRSNDTRPRWQRYALFVILYLIVVWDESSKPYGHPYHTHRSILFSEWDHFNKLWYCAKTNCTLWFLLLGCNS